MGARPLRARHGAPAAVAGQYATKLWAIGVALPRVSKENMFAPAPTVDGAQETVTDFELDPEAKSRLTEAASNGLVTGGFIEKIH